VKIMTKVIEDRRQRNLITAEIYLARAAQALAFAGDSEHAERALRLAHEVQTSRREPAAVAV
jgi:hypothetical protein